MAAFPRRCRAVGAWGCWVACAYLCGALLLRLRFHVPLAFGTGGAGSGSSGGASGSNGALMAIPRRLIFTHRINMLTASRANMSDTEQRLAANVQDSIRTHFPRQWSAQPPPQSQGHNVVDFYDDAACAALLRATSALPDPADRAFLLEHYWNEEGPYKGDTCRAAALYETGGVYLDVDIVPREPLWQLVEESRANFATVCMHKACTCFFQAVVVASPRHPIFLLYLQLTLEYYRGIRKMDGCNHLGPSLLRTAYDMWQEATPPPPPPPPSAGSSAASAVAKTSEDSAPGVPHAALLLREDGINDNFWLWWSVPAQPGYNCFLDDSVVYDPVTWRTVAFSRLPGVKYCSEHSLSRDLFGEPFARNWKYPVLGPACVGALLLAMRAGVRCAARARTRRWAANVKNRDKYLPVPTR